jgi:hypothetical protein
VVKIVTVVLSMFRVMVGVNVDSTIVLTVRTSVRVVVGTEGFIVESHSVLHVSVSGAASNGIATSKSTSKILVPKKPNILEE